MFRRNISPPSSGPNKPSLKMEAICSSETWVDFQRTIQCYNPEDSTHHNHRYENLKSIELSVSDVILMISFIQWTRLQTELIRSATNVWNYCIWTVKKVARKTNFNRRGHSYCSTLLSSGRFNGRMLRIHVTQGPCHQSVERPPVADWRTKLFEDAISTVTVILRRIIRDDYRVLGIWED
jgi:hypothetical protein